MRRTFALGMMALLGMLWLVAPAQACDQDGPGKMGKTGVFPKVVLDHAKDLGLSKDQKGAVKKIASTLKKETRDLNKQVEKKRDQVANWLKKEKDVADDRLRAAMVEIGQLKGEIRFAWTKAKRDTRKVLNADQLAKYRALDDGGCSMGKDCPMKKGDMMKDGGECPMKN